MVFVTNSTDGNGAINLAAGYDNVRFVDRLIIKGSPVGLPPESHGGDRHD